MADHTDTPTPNPLMEQVLYEVKKVVVGQDHFLERVLIALLARGHLLVEGVPGLAKTLTINTLATAIRRSPIAKGFARYDRPFRFKNS